MKPLANRNAQVDSRATLIDDDGELQGFVFCLHCHTVNSADAKICVACQQPIVELPADLRDRLERISAYNDHGALDDDLDDAVQTRRRHLVWLAIGFFLGVVLSPLFLSGVYLCLYLLRIAK